MNSTRSWIKLLSTSCIGLLCALAFGQAAATTGAVNTTDDPGFPETAYTDQPCTNGPTHTTPEINCNQYLDKRDVWLSGLAPKPSQLGVGTYFFAVLVPGTQSDPNDGTVGNLSTSDTYLARTFTVDSDGVISNWGSHLFDSVNDIIQLAPYDNTTNPGGVYILAVCQYTGIAGTGPLPGVNPSTCKYDAFKVVASACTSGDPSCCTGDGCQQPPPPLPLAITKDATGAYTDTFTWQITKSVDKTIVNIINDGSAATATFNYTVGVTREPGTVSDVGVSGTISVVNPNVEDPSVPGSNTVEVDAYDVTDELSDSIVCTVDKSGGLALTAFKTKFPYTCSLTALPDPSVELDNTAEVTWSDQPLLNGAFLAGGFKDFTFANIVFTATNVDDCVTVTDSLVATAGGPTCSSTTFTYSKTVPAPAVPTCATYNNTATFTTDTTGATGSDSKSVQVCHYRTALTVGYWKTHLANSSSKGPWYDSNCTSKTVTNSGAGCSANGPWTKQYLSQTLGNYVVDSILKAAQVWAAMTCSNASSSDNNAEGCLAGQLLAAKLNVANGSCPGNPAISATIGAADDFLKTKTNPAYNGPGSYTLNTRALAISLANTLNSYNNGNGC